MHLLRPACLSLICLAFFAACVSKPGNEQGAAADSTATDTSTVPVSKPDTLAYKLATVEVLAKGCAPGSKMEACTHARVIYPDLGGSGAPVQLASNLMRDLALATDLVADTIRRVPSLESLTKAFVDSFETERKIYLHLDPESTIKPWYMEVDGKLSEAQGLVFLNLTVHRSTGGDHPVIAWRHHAYDRKSGAPVSLQNLLQNPADQDELRRMLTAKVYSDNDTYVQPRMLLKKNRFPLPKSWYLTDSFLVFTYNQEEKAKGKYPFKAPKEFALPLDSVERFFTPAYRKQVL